MKTTSFKEKASKYYSFKPESTNPAVRTKMKEKIAEKENFTIPIAKEHSELVKAGSVSGSTMGRKGHLDQFKSSDKSGERAEGAISLKRAHDTS